MRLAEKTVNLDNCILYIRKMVVMKVHKRYTVSKEIIDEI